MDSGIYSAATGLRETLRAQEITANNLANVNTPGYKRRLAVFHPFQRVLAQQLDQGTVLGGVVVDFSPGPIHHTGNPLDLAIEGKKGFFVLRGSNGYLYTRKGSFTLRGDGTIVDTVGRPLLADGGGELRVPPETREIRVTTSGEVYADQTAIGRIWVVEFDGPPPLVAAAYTAFALAEGARQPATAAQPRILQGALEGSNTNAVDELVSMIALLRSFEASQRTAKAIDESLKETTTVAQQSGG